MDNRIDRRGLTGSRSSGEHKHTFSRGCHDCLPLVIREFKSGRLLDMLQALIHMCLGNIHRGIQLLQTQRNVRLHIIKDCCIDMNTIQRLFFDNPAFYRQIHEIFLYCFCRHSEQIYCPHRQLLLRQISMSFSGCLLQTVEQAAADTKIGVCAYADLGRDLVCNPESNTIDIVRQPVWILLQDTVQFLSISIVDPDCEIQIDPILLQKQHC